jgi:hypothetical protein
VINKVLAPPFLLPIQSKPIISDNVLRLMIQASRYTKLKLDFSPQGHEGWHGTAVDPDGLEHRRSTVKSWTARGMFSVSQDGFVLTVELTDAGIRWLQYLRNMLNEVPL